MGLKFNLKTIKEILFILSFLFVQFGSAQSILNGNFENNTGTIGNDYLNLTNVQFDSSMQNCYGFGPLNAELDIISSSFWGAPPQNGNWCVGIATRDLLAIELSATIFAGDTHTISFYEAGREINPCAYNIEIGLSTTNNSFGTLIYSAPGIPEWDLWTPHLFTFIAPNNGNYITVRLPGTPPCWAAIDRFCLDTICIDDDTARLEMPNVFSPNGDGVNDIFQPIIFTNIVNPSLLIYNRWGDEIFQTNDLFNGWDGNINGNKCADGVYYWILKYSNSRREDFQITGMVTVVRE